MVESQLPSVHFESLLMKMNQSRLEGRFCDVQLTVHSQHVNVHRCVLAACSPYFSGMFSGNFVETEKGMTTIDLSDSITEVVHLETVLRAIYTGHLSLDRSNIGGVTQLVSFLMIDSLKELCVQFLLSDITLQTSINYFVIADMYDIEEVKSYCFLMMEFRFHDYFIHEDDILQVSPHHLNLLFQGNIQRNCDAIQILQLLFSWATYKDFGERVSTATYVFHSICAGLDFQGIREMHSWLESHKEEETNVIAEFMTIVKCVMNDHEMQDDVDKTTDSEVNTLEKEVESNSASSQYLKSEDFLKPDNSLSKSCRQSLTPTTSLHDFSNSCDSNQLSNDSELYTNCLIVLAPTCEVVKNVLAIEMENKRQRLQYTTLDISFYKCQQKIWLHFGSVTFPGVIDDKSNWRLSCGSDKLYFVSATRDNGYCLNMKTRSWQTMDCHTVLEGLSGDVRSLIPLVVDGSLYVLASNRQISETRDFYETHQRYYRLLDDMTWLFVSEVSHEHSSMPLSLISISEATIYVVKAEIAVNMAKNLLLIKEGHTFNTSTNQIEKFSATTYVPSPVRVMVKEGVIYILDGEGWLRSYNKDKKQFEFPTQVNLSDIRWCRAYSIEGHFPCMSHLSTGAGGGVWELTSFQQNGTALLEIVVGTEGGVNTKIHIPPPYKYFTMATAGKVHNSLLSLLKRSSFLHV